MHIMAIFMGGVPLLLGVFIIIGYIFDEDYRSQQNKEIKEGAGYLAIGCLVPIVLIAIFIMWLLNL